MNRLYLPKIIFLPVLLLIICAATIGMQRAVGQPLDEPIVLPAKFERQTVIDGFELPSAMTFLPNGDLLVTEKGAFDSFTGSANIYLVTDLDSAEADKKRLITLSTNSRKDSGLMSIVASPDFADTGYFYVWYATSEGALDWSGQSMTRLSRFTLASDQTVAAASEVIIIEAPWSTVHNGGAMLFTPDGALYLAVGELGWIVQEAVELSNLRGKLLRIRPNNDGYTIPDDNPYVDTPNARPEIFSQGLRNPFRMVQRPGDGALFVADIGGSVWEEINRVAPGVNYGWPEREGICVINVPWPCTPAPDHFTDPTFYYPHSSSNGAIVGMDYYQTGDYPLEYHNKLFVSDYEGQWIAVVDPEGGEWAGEKFAENVGILVDVKYHDGVLYTLDIIEGTLARIVYTGEPAAPIAVIDADKVLGAPPLQVVFSAERSVQPTDTVLHYVWDFADGGAPITTTTPTISHTFTSEGNFDVALTVFDSRQSERATQRVTAYAGEVPTISLSVTGEPTRALFHGGDVWQFAAEREHSADLAPQPYHWDIELHHKQHIHPELTNFPASAGAWDIPSDYHGDNIFYRFHLTMHTSSGIDVTVTRDLYPAFSDVTLQYRPAATGVAFVDGVQQFIPHTFTTVVGTEHEAVSLVEPTFISNGIYQFDSWYFGDYALSDTLFTVPAEPTTFTGRLIWVRDAEQIFLPTISLRVK